MSGKKKPDLVRLSFISWEQLQAPDDMPELLVLDIPSEVLELPVPAGWTPRKVSPIQLHDVELTDEQELALLEHCVSGLFVHVEVCQRGKCTSLTGKVDSISNSGTLGGNVDGRKVKPRKWTDLTLAVVR